MNKCVLLRKVFFITNAMYLFVRCVINSYYIMLCSSMFVVLLSYQKGSAGFLLSLLTVISIHFINE